MTTPTLPPIFISYASVDLAFAEEVSRRLTGVGFKVWFDKARLRAGCDWHKEIEAGCEASRVILPVLTPRWKLSDWTKFETYGAEAVIPLVFEGAFEAVSTPPLTRFQALALDLTTRDGASWERLSDSLRTLLAEPPPDKIVRTADLRYTANPYFVGRERDLNAIHEALHQSPTPGLTQGRVRAITALGGVGKTTLARQYIEKFWRCYPQIFWVDCRLGVETEFARVCDRLFPGAQGVTDVGEKARRAFQELQTRVDRLLILDNAENETAVQAWIPKTGHCRTLITSRFTAWSAAIPSTHLDVLDSQSARALLVRRGGGRDFTKFALEEQTACDALATELGYLPIALEQAAAYVAQEGPSFSFAEYLESYGRAAAELLAAGVLGSTEYPDSVITTWKATLAKLDSASRAILRLCAFLASTPLPLTVLFEGTEVLLEEATTVEGAPLPAFADTKVWVRSKVKNLRDYSMVDGDGKSIWFHPLVLTVQRLNLDVASGEARETLARSLRWLEGAFVGDPHDVRSWPVLDPLAKHAEVVVRFADKTQSPGTTYLMCGLAALFTAKGSWSAAEPLLRRALSIDELAYGHEHPRVAMELNNLAELLQVTNRLDEAEPLLRRALNINDLAYGGEHPTVATQLNNLGQLLQATNRFDEAETLMRRALSIDEQSLGPESSHVATDLNNLGQLLRATNRLDQAELLMRRALSIDERSFGPGHPRVAGYLTNLAQLLQMTNRLDEAEPLMRRALAIDEHSYGPEHPRIATCLNVLADLLRTTNRLDEAEPLVRRALAIDEHSYGPGHTSVAKDLNHLAQLLQTSNRLDEAEPLVRRALAIDEHSYGLKHPSVANSLSLLAELLQATNRLGEAEPLMRRALDIDEHSFGPKHPRVAIDLNNLAGLLQATSRLDEAEPLLRRALDIDEHSFGPKHPRVAIDLNNLGQLLQATSRVDEAEPLLRRALDIGEHSYGLEHPNVATFLGTLAHLLQTTNRLAEVEPLLRRALDIDESSYGPDHPSIARDLNNLAVLLQLKNRPDEAEPLMRRALAINERCYGPEHPRAATDLNNLAQLLQATNRLAEAEPLMRQGLELLLKFGRSTGHAHPNLNMVFENYSSVLQRLGLEEAVVKQRLTEVLAPYGLSLQP